MTKFSLYFGGNGLRIRVRKSSWVRRVAALLMREHWRQPRSSPRHVRDGCRASIEDWDTCSATFLRAVVECLGQCHPQLDHWSLDKADSAC